MTMRRPDAAPGHTRTHARTQPRPQAAPPPAARRHYTSAHTDRHMAHGASRQPAACATRDAVLRHTRTHARTQPHPRNSTATNSKRRRQTAVGSRTCGLERPASQQGSYASHGAQDEWSTNRSQIKKTQIDLKFRRPNSGGRGRLIAKAIVYPIGSCGTGIDNIVINEPRHQVKRGDRLRIAARNGGYETTISFNYE